MKKLIAIVMCVVGLNSILCANDLARLFLSGKSGGHMGLYYQGMTGGAPSFVDANVSLSYVTQRFNGVEFGGSMWAAVKLFQSHSGDFSKVKRDFVLTEVYGGFINPDRISIYAGRFKTNSEWIKHFTQGVAVTYEDIENLNVEFIWAWKNAYVTDYRMDDFYNPYGNVGSIYLGATLRLPETLLDITPYLYSAPNDFVAFGAKILVEVPVNDAILYGKMHFLSFSGKNDKQIDFSTTDGDGGFIWFEGGARWRGMNTGGGVISVAENGARGIDSFGQSSFFERREGLFYNNATTLYGFLEYDIKHYMQLDSAIRHTSIGSKSIFNWEVGVTSEPQEGVIKLGVKVVGMINNADFTLDNSIFANDGRNYLLTRVFGKVSF